ncbi:50S ribosomal protein L44e [Candidatus Micrarchaeota archaeon]|nr:50S ribosomal protein L44e [Candidatus Micrarchaeota archaeon]
MNFPKEIRVFCPKCNTHTVHKAKTASKGKSRGAAWGNLKHARKLKGHKGKVAGEKTVRKQGKRQVVILACEKCKKRQFRTIGTRTKKKLETKV